MIGFEDYNNFKRHGGADIEEFEYDLSIACRYLQDLLKFERETALLFVVEEDEDSIVEMRSFPDGKFGLYGMYRNTFGKEITYPGRWPRRHGPNSFPCFTAVEAMRKAYSPGGIWADREWVRSLEDCIVGDSIEELLDTYNKSKEEMNV